jgi:hypothetical protein
MTTQLEQHLMSVEQPSAREMFNVFLDSSRGKPARVVGFGPQGVMVQSTKASSLTPHDMNLLRSLSDEGRPTGTYVLDLSSGPTSLELTSLGSSNSVVVVGDAPSSRSASISAGSTLTSPLVRNIGRSPNWLSVVNQVEKFRALREPIILLGESGVGKTSLALGAPYKSGPVPTDVALSDAAERHILGTRQWLVRLAQTISANNSVVIRGIETLDTPALEGMKAILDSQVTPSSVIMTMTTDNADDVQAAELTFNSRCLWVPALRDRTEDLPELWHELSQSALPKASVAPNAEALALMRAYAWPGNIKELRRLIGQLAVSGKIGPILPTDLPAAMQSSKTLSLIERVELEAIRKALQDARGNRVKAADILGVSRATVYRKMKAYKIAAE